MEVGFMKYSIREKIQTVKKMNYFYYWHNFEWNFNGLDTHRKWLFSFIIVLLLGKSQNFQKILRNTNKFL